MWDFLQAMLGALRNEDLAELDPLTNEEGKISCDDGMRGPLKEGDLNITGLREALRRIDGALKYFSEETLYPCFLDRS